MATDLIQEGLHSRGLVPLASNDAVASDGGDELRLLLQQGAQGCPLLRPTQSAVLNLLRLLLPPI